jgi:hypothetical protein
MSRPCPPEVQLRMDEAVGPAYGHTHRTRAGLRHRRFGARRHKAAGPN